MSVFARVSLAGAIVLAPLSHACAATAPGATQMASVVALIEPHPSSATGNGYRISVGGSSALGGAEILRALSPAAGGKLIILAHEGVTLGAVLDLVAAGSKVGCVNYDVYIFDKARKEMVPIPGFKSMPFSTQPDK